MSPVRPSALTRVPSTNLVIDRQNYSLCKRSWHLLFLSWIASGPFFCTSHTTNQYLGVRMSSDLQTGEFACPYQKLHAHYRNHIILECDFCGEGGAELCCTTCDSRGVPYHDISKTTFFLPGCRLFEAFL